VSHNGSQGPPEDIAGLRPSVPVMPSVPRGELYRGHPFLLLESGLRHSLGWEDDRKAGPSFVVTRLRGLDSRKVTDRFPLTEQGWASAWRALSDLDASAAAAIAAKLAEREAGRRAAAELAALDAKSVCLRRVVFNGGSGGVPLSKGRFYDLRFLDDRIMACEHDLMDATVEVPYRDVETMEVSGPGMVGMSTGALLALILGLGLLGALLGYVIHRLLGLLLGALVLGFAGAFVGVVSTRTETIVRIRGRDAEFYFLNNEIGPDALRIGLSEPLRAIRNARAAQADEPAELASGSIADQLSKLASLLQQGLITRDEFERLKAKLIAKSY
jgi:Short C-terminal domain